MAQVLEFGENTVEVTTLYTKMITDVNNLGYNLIYSHSMRESFWYNALTKSSFICGKGYPKIRVRFHGFS